MPPKTFAHGGATWLAMDRPRDELGIVVERTDQRMFIEKRQRLLLRRFTLEQLANRPQPVTTV